MKEEEEEGTSFVFGTAGKGLRVGFDGKHIETAVLKTLDQKTSRSTKGIRKTSTTLSLSSSLSLDSAASTLTLTGDQNVEREMKNESK